MIYVKRALKDRQFCCIFLIVIVLVAIPIFAPWIAPNNPIENDYGNLMITHSKKYPLGTDQIGRCILSRLIYGGRTSLLIVFLVIAIIASVGILIGVVSGLFGGWIDQILTRIVDIAMAVPSTVFVIALVSVLGSSLWNTVLAMSIIGWTEYARITRSLVLSIRENDYIASARFAGMNSRQIALRYIVPNVVPYLLVNITQDIGDKLLTLGSLSLLGLASQPPTPEWGFMVSEGRKFIQTKPHLIIYPGMAIMIHVIAFNLLGDRLRDILDPKYKFTEKRRKRKK